MITSGKLPPGYEVWVKDGGWCVVREDGAYEVKFAGESRVLTVQLYAPDAKYRNDAPLREIDLNVRDGEVIEGVDFDIIR